MPGEFDLIRRIRDKYEPSSRVRLGPGDDCAILVPRPAATLITTDMLMEGVDFILAEVGPRAVGRKAMAVNLSDIAAMAGIPTAALVSVALPQGNDTRALAEELIRGLREVGDEFEVPIIGGDTNSWTGGLVINVTVLGEPNPHSGPVLRSGAKVGDRIFITGPCGGSILGRHLNPRPRLREAVELARRFRLHSMIDISDGLSADLGHILEESGVGAVLNAEAIPIQPDAVRLSERTGLPSLEHALGDGEDFELIFTVRCEEAKTVAQSGLAIEIGEVIASGYFLTHNGRRELLVPKGWSHPL
jgi:thiamine-monophosphate kinase